MLESLFSLLARLFSRSGGSPASSSTPSAALQGAANTAPVSAQAGAFPVPTSWPSIKAMQADFKARGHYAGEVDSDFGPKTLDALIAAYDREGKVPAWMRVARKELGVAEIAGSKHNSRILEYHMATDLKATEDEVPWCSSFVNWVFLQLMITRTKSAAARSWVQWGKAIMAARFGAVCVYSRGSFPSGHVAFFLVTIAGSEFVLGGNQGNRVSVAPQSRVKLLGYRWPA